MNIDEELEEIFDDPLLKISETEAKLLDIPEDMRKVKDPKKKADYVVDSAAEALKILESL